MDADHVTAWSRGGSTDISNCQMLCKTHNRAKDMPHILEMCGMFDFIVGKPPWFSIFVYKILYNKTF